MLLKLAILGCAHIHMSDAAEVIEADPRARVTGLWDHDAARAQHWARRLAAPRAARPEEAFADADAVIVMSETVRHPALVSAASAAGKDLFVEKPLGRTAAEAAEMRAAIERAGVRFHTGYLLRDVDAHRRIRELIAAGSLGTLVRARGRFAHPGALAGWFDDFPWTVDREAAGFGGFADEGVHVIDLLTWALGRSIVAGTAEIGRVTAGAKIDERGEALVRLEDGTPATIAAGWTEPALTAELCVTGTQGEARVFAGELIVEAPGCELREPASAPDSRQPISHFIAALTGESTRPLVTAREAETHCQILEGLYRAAAEGVWLRLEHPLAS
ncbi:MAG: Gfo/Idh/MocA family oxidoreductase [Halofilum sp. (in: g-proteobacteria)]